MTKVIEGVDVLTFAEWKEIPAVKEMESQLDDCDTCDGDGEHECDCGDTHDCGACHGTGKEKDIREIYEAGLRAEISRLAAWEQGYAIKNPSNGMEISKRKRVPITRVILNIPGNPAKVKE